MTRPLLLALVLAALAMAVAAPASAAPAPAQPEISIDFRLPANNGLHAHLTNPKKLQLEIRRKGRLVVYEAPG
ncbi:MAG TPA: hypothetical protein VG518_04190, partial [Solirubrobacterales bacterium]|nr:hypothetical protein [Solirubrobacterales bacterium]